MTRLDPRADPDPGGTPPASRSGSSGSGSTSLSALVRLARPKQWAKNVLVFAAPGAAGVLDQRGPLLDTVAAFVAFCLVAAGTYYVNDARDVEADRRHPTKCRRPVAAGEVRVGTAIVAGAVLAAAGIALAFTVRWQLGVTVAGYVVLTSVYSAVLKRIAVVDLVAVTAGFVLRAIAGGAATGVPISEWFFIVATFGSLFMVSGKRGAEAAEMGGDATAVRSVLGAYSPTYTAYLRSVTSGVVLVAYCLWAFEDADAASSTIPWFQLSIVPFIVGILRYALVLDQGRGSAPEEVVLSDRPLQAAGLVWVVVYAIGVYAS